MTAPYRNLVESRAPSGLIAIDRSSAFVAGTVRKAWWVFADQIRIVPSILPLASVRLLGLAASHTRPA